MAVRGDGAVRWTVEGRRSGWRGAVRHGGYRRAGKVNGGVGGIGDAQQRISQIDDEPLLLDSFRRDSAVVGKYQKEQEKACR